MKNNQPTTNKEIPMKEGTILVSRTDLKGKIVSANQHFIDISGFTSDELIGSSHNIVRHPFMPSPIFKNLWHTIQSGCSWSGLIKNRCKNGDFYWVMANVTPLRKDGKIEGFMSLRTKPTRKQKSDAERLYQKINTSNSEEENFIPPKTKLQRLGIKTPASRYMGVIGISIFTQFLLITEAIAAASWPVLVATFITGSLITLLAGRSQINDLNDTVRSIVGKLREIGEGKYFNFIDVDQPGELNNILNEVKMTQIKLGFNVINANETILRIVRLNSELDTVTSNFQTTATSIDDSASSVIQISSTVKDNAARTLDAEKRMNHARIKVKEGGNHLHKAQVAMKEINEASNQIFSIVSLIDDIAFKTQLLSINASVEAAHAGDQGKGFSVVATEVRNLAHHAASAASDIKQLVDDSQVKISSGQDRVQNAGKSLEHVIAEVNQMSELLGEIANAGTEQSAGVDTLASSMQLLNKSIQENTKRVAQTTSTGRALGAQAEKVMNNSGMVLH